MAKHALRILLAGGDASTWIGMSTALGLRSSQILAVKDIDAGTLHSAAGDIDVIVLVTSGSDTDPCAPIRLIREAGMQNRTLVLAHGEDERTAAEAISMGVAGYVLRGSSPKHVAFAITRIAAGGAVYDKPAASTLHHHGETVRTDGTLGRFTGAARALAAALELKDTYTGGHAERVTALASRLAQAARLEDALPSEALETAFLLHDVGKIGIPESILNKPGSLTEPERRVLNTHPILGERIVAPLGLPECVRQVIRHHHERWDGLGYPDGLAGGGIPTAARIFAIADVIDAMTSLRPYRRPVSFEAAVEEIMRHGGTQFDPTLAALAEETFLDAPVEIFGATQSSDF
jgi:HD-GYP domain-containing protein (c-di-GMP phosphodiesterase class II)